MLSEQIEHLKTLRVGSGKWTNALNALLDAARAEQKEDAEPVAWVDDFTLSELGTPTEGSDCRALPLWSTPTGPDGERLNPLFTAMSGGEAQTMACDALSAAISVIGPLAKDRKDHAEVLAKLSQARARVIRMTASPPPSPGGEQEAVAWMMKNAGGGLTPVLAETVAEWRAKGVGIEARALVYASPVRGAGEEGPAAWRWRPLNDRGHGWAVGCDEPPIDRARWEVQPLYPPLAREKEMMDAEGIIARALAKSACGDYPTADDRKIARDIWAALRSSLDPPAIGPGPAGGEA